MSGGSAAHARRLGLCPEQCCQHQRLQLKQENLQLHKELDKLPKTALLVKNEAQLQVCSHLFGRSLPARSAFLESDIPALKYSREVT